LRSGTKPSRFTYPCQQAAFSTASLAFGAPLAAALVAARRRLLAGLRTPVGITAAAMGLLVTIGLGGYLSRATAYSGPRPDPPRGYRAQLFHVTDCPQDPVGDRFPGLDNLLRLMGHEGFKFYRSPNESFLAGPDGIIAADDTVVIKINYQWDQRGGTNTDLLSGLIRCIVDHPDTFTGEIAVCENAQIYSGHGFDRDWNNCQNRVLSPHELVVWFQDLGCRISHFDWGLVRFTEVNEYSDGDTTDGYVVYEYDPDVDGRVSYPKYQTDYGTYISLKYGTWDPDAETYDREHLKLINVPVLKSHADSYGATVCVKNYMGVVTNELDTNSHYGIEFGILGALQGEIQLADLNILDCIWINAVPDEGPYTPYYMATRRDELLASLDPVATDIWAVKNILIPAFIDNGYSPPWPYPSADPDDPNSMFRTYLDNSMYQILAAGYNVTNDYDQIDVATWDGQVGNADLNGDGCVGHADLGILLGDWGCTNGGCPGDIDYDGDTDHADLGILLAHWGEGCQ